MQRQSYGMQTQLRMREARAKNPPGNSYFLSDLYVVVFLFKLPKRMGDTYV